MNLAAQIKSVKPHLAPSSLRNYVISLEKTHQRVTGDRSIHSLSFLLDTAAVLDTLKEMTPTTRRNYLNAMVVGVQALVDKYADNPAYKEYSKERDDLNTSIKAAATSGEKSEKQAKNWISPEEYEAILQTYKKYFSKNRIFSKDLDSGDLRLLQEFALLKLYQQMPTRNDLATIRVISQPQYTKIQKQKLTENYLVTDRDKYYFVINRWKTKKTDDERRRIDVPPDIKKVLKLLISKQAGDYLFTNRNGTPLKRNGLTKYLQSIFKKFHPERSVSTSMLRHMYLTSKYGKVKEEMGKDAELLAHSAATQKDYIKDKE